LDLCISFYHACLPLHGTLFSSVIFIVSIYYYNNIQAQSTNTQITFAGQASLDDNDEDGSWENFQEETRAGQQWITQPPTHQMSPHGDDEDNSDGDNDGDGGDEEGWRRSQEGRSGQQWEQHHTTPHTQYF